MDHTIALIQKSHEGDEEARAQIVEENTGLVWCIVRRFTGRGTELEDLFQIGTIGLLKAIDKFDLIKDIRPRKYSEESLEGSRRSQNLQSILMCHRKNLRWRWMHVRM